VNDGMAVRTAKKIEFLFEIAFIVDSLPQPNLASSIGSKTAENKEKTSVTA